MEFSLVIDVKRAYGNIGVKKEVDEGTIPQPPIVN